MKLIIKRNLFTPTETLGELSIDGKFFCYTLEDTVRENGVKVHGETAIPYGTYKVIVNMSNRFKRLMPLLIDVPNFEGVRLHGGNSHVDSHGCPLIAYKAYKNKPHPTLTKIKNWIQGSSEKDLTKILLETKDPISLTIIK